MYFSDGEKTKLLSEFPKKFKEEGLVKKLLAGDKFPALNIEEAFYK